MSSKVHRRGAVVGPCVDVGALVLQVLEHVQVALESGKVHRRGALVGPCVDVGALVLQVLGKPFDGIELVQVYLEGAWKVRDSIAINKFGEMIHAPDIA